MKNNTSTPLLLLLLLVMTQAGCHAAAVINLRNGKSIELRYDSEVRRERELAFNSLGCDPCPAGEYMVSPCAGGPDTTPTCAACGGACPAGETLVEPCGATNDRVCAPEVHAACARKAVTLDVASLNAITEDHCDDCATRLPHINTALKEGYMACPLRLSAFIAQARHATDGFQVMASSFSYVAGAIHLQPASFRLACKQLPELKSAFQAKFTSCPMSNKCDCGGDAEAAEIVGRNEFAFKVGVWWFATGSNQLLSEPCGDLRLDSDWGLGGAPYWTSKESPGTGFQKTTTCIAGFGSDPGRQQRANYYVAARAFFPDKDPDPLFSAASSTSIQQTLLLLAAACLACLGSMYSFWV